MSDLPQKYQRLKLNNDRVCNILSTLKELPTLVFNHDGWAALRKNKHFYFIDFSQSTHGCCDVCLEKEQTTAHHIVPGRFKTSNIILKEMRIRVCEECVKKIHPENKVDGKGIIDKQNGHIKNLENEITRLKDIGSLPMIEEIKEKIKLLEENVKLVKDTCTDKKKIHAMHRYYEGRIYELKMTIKLLKRYVKPGCFVPKEKRC